MPTLSLKNAKVNLLGESGGLAGSDGLGGSAVPRGREFAPFRGITGSQRRVSNGGNVTVCFSFLKDDSD